ncbi:hypothetical protein MXB_2326 [Myxobolus squamalis]|nr:hypothetical protein MXB_2326 [Myxobolus squamalis]
MSRDYVSPIIPGPVIFDAYEDEIKNSGCLDEYLKVLECKFDHTCWNNCFGVIEDLKECLEDKKKH